MKRFAVWAFAFVAVACLVAGSRPAKAVTAGTLIKGSGSTVYYYAEDGKRHVFPTEKIFKSWYADFTGITQLSDAELAAIPLGANVNYRPGVRLIKIQTDPRVYAIGKGGALHWIASEEIARALYGNDWNTQIDDIPDAFFFNYHEDTSIQQASDFDLNGARAVASINDDLSAHQTSTSTTSNPSSAPSPSTAPTAPTCTADTWSCTDWNACSSSGNQTRLCSMTKDCASATTPSPATSQSCTPPTAAPAPTTTTSQTTANLLADPGFETGASGFAAQDTRNSAVRTTTAPIAGTGSLAVSINAWGDNVWWMDHVTGTSITKASRLSVSGTVRGDVVRSDSTLQFCAAVYYAGSGDITQHCVDLSKTAGAVGHVEANLDLDATRALGDVDIRLTLNGPGPVTYTLDDVSAVLTLPGGTTTPPPPTCTADTWSCTDWNACSTGGSQTRLCTMTHDCPNVTTPSPATSQSCTPPSTTPPPSCTTDTWTCGNWSACSTSGNQTRSCSLTTDCPNVTTPSPTTSQSCTPPSTTPPPPPPTAGYTAVLSDSGSTTPLPLITDAQDPAEPNMTPALHVSVPSAQCQRMLNMVSPAIAIPTTSHIREVEASWNGTPLPLITPVGDVTEEPHGWGNPIPFFKPLFSTASVPSGSGTLTIKAFDAAHAQLTSVDIPNLLVAKAPTPLTAAQIGAQAHPRVYLTPTRLAQIKAKPASDPSVQRFWSTTDGVGYFLQFYSSTTDPESSSFVNQVYDPESYIPALALCYQLDKTSDPTTAAKCADAAKKMALRISDDYNSGARAFSADDGYNIRFDLRNMLLAYDWMYDQFTSTQRAQMVSVATRWVDWYPGNGYASTQPVENYYAGYLQGLTLASVVTAGDNSAADRLLGVLRSELSNKVPVLDQRVCGGDWPEGWNYGPYTVLEFSLVNQTLKDVGEDWSADFDFVQPVARSFTYQVTNDLQETVPFGDYSGDYEHFMRPSLLAVLSSTSSDGALASRLYTSMLANATSDIHAINSRGDTFYEMAFGDLTSQSANVSSLPLSYLNAGDGRYFSKSSMTDASGYLVTTENVPYGGDHYGYADGDVQLFHGSTCILCSSAYRGSRFFGLGETKMYSTYLVNGQGTGVSRNDQTLFNVDNGSWSAEGMRYESSYVPGRYDENMMSSAMPLDYLIREVVHIRPGILVVRDLHRRRHATDTLVANWHLGSSAAVQTVGTGQYKIGSTNVSTFTNATTAFTADKDAGGNVIGTLETQTFPAGTTGMESVSVFSDVATATSYANGVLHLSTGQCVTFANGAVSVASCQ